MMQKQTFGAAVVALASLASGAAQAAQVFTHTGDANPVTEGWTAMDIVAGVAFNPAFRATIGGFTDLDGTKYWKVHDDIDATSWTSRYQVTPSGSATGNLTEYWRLSAFVRGYANGGGANSAGNSQLVVNAHHFSAGPVGAGVAWTISFDDDSMTIGGNGGAGGGGGTHEFALNDGFNWIELVFDPTQFSYNGGTGTYLNSGVSLYLNGVLLLEDAPLATVNNQGNVVMWGDMILVNGGFGGADYGFVEFARSETALSPLAVPEPASAAGLGVAGLLAVMCRRR